MSRRPVDGVLLLDKPSGITSNAALQKARRLYQAVKAGHTGTLDPLATGLLPVCFGEATKFSAGLLDADKSYIAELRLGVTTTTGDAEGAVLAERSVTVGRSEVDAALARFRGEIDQIPPMYSALKRDGRPLYDYARKGVEVDRAPRRVRIHGLRLREFEGARVQIEVDCSKGTYIRTLAEDIGNALGCGAHLTALRRTRIGPLRVEEAHTLAALESTDVQGRDKALLPLDTLVAEYPAVHLDGERARRFCNGNPVRGDVFLAGPLRVYLDGHFLGLGEGRANGLLAPRRLSVPEGIHAGKPLD